MSNENRPWLDGVEGEKARELIESNAKVIRVVAGPGAGKTFCLGRRTWRLIEGDGINQRKIFVGTISRIVITGLQKELASYGDIKVSTLHSLAYKLLRDNPSACQGMKLRFLLDFERRALLYDVKSEVSIRTVYDCQKGFRELGAELATRDENIENALFRGSVERWLKRHQAMLFEYVVYLCVDSLKHESIQPIFDHVVIDEYQDLTVVEQELMDLLWSHNGSLMVMGDDSQSIYGFRWNKMNAMADFHEAWVNRGYEYVDVPFSKNRRCGCELLRVANRMQALTGNPTQMLWGNDRIGNLDLVHWDSLEEETKGLATYIKHRLKSRPDEKFLILVPRLFMGYRLKEEIGEEARTMFREGVLEHPIAQEAFTAASLLANANDRVAIRAWLGFKHGESKHADSRNSAAYANLLRDVPSSIGGHELLRKIVDQDDVNISGRGQKNIRIRAKRAIDLIDRNLEPREIVDYLFDPVRAECEEDDDKRHQLRDSLEKLLSAAREMLEEQDSPDLGKVLDQLRYKITMLLPLETDAGDPRVKIMTIYTSKGLEEDNVVIAGVVDQFIPGLAVESEEIEEQGRLLYVAVTRAKDSLIVSWPQSIPVNLMMSNGGRIDRYTFHNGVRCAETSRSRFLNRIGSSTKGADWLSRSIDPGV